MTEEEKQAQYTGFSVVAGNVGYLREAYHGDPYITHFLVAEAFDSKEGEARIPAEVMRERLPKAVIMAMYRNNKLYGGDKDPANQDFENIGEALSGAFASMATAKENTKAIAESIDEASVEHGKFLIESGTLPDYAQTFVEFVELCERKEKETGEAVMVVASY